MPKITVTIDTDTHKVVPIEPTYAMIQYVDMSVSTAKNIIKVAPEYTADTNVLESDQIPYTEREIVTAAVDYIKTYACIALNDLETDKDVKCYKKLKALAGMAKGYCPELDKHYDRLDMVIHSKPDPHICDASGYAINEATGHDTQ